ncbi:hypothetical protein HPB47_000429 [Ixodes persulcatus]|uniref:Uncharacterized protein n=1 Tax=Ixodes persulcatus TaxID=34615 RepID=A0AC60PTC1_IXOPE|nr:hypothetical protein HPB47_000429 [Ixodes persulcatus]
MKKNYFACSWVVHHSFPPPPQRYRSQDDANHLGSALSIPPASLHFGAPAVGDSMPLPSTTVGGYLSPREVTSALTG